MFPSPLVEKRLSEMEIPFLRHEHPPVWTVEEANEHCSHLIGGHTKNLFLRNKKKTQFFLVTVESSKSVDLNALQAELEESKLSFGNTEELERLLGTYPGAVSLLGILNDAHHEVRVILDDDLLQFPVMFSHPNDNAVTLEIRTEDIRHFLDLVGNSWEIRDIPTRVV